jgi:uncharacterized protein YkwD
VVVIARGGSATMVFVRTTTLVLALILSFGALANAADYDPQVEQKLFQLINAERAKRGIPELKWNDKLQQSARKHTQRLAENETLSHQFSGEPNVQSRIAETGLHFSASAENVASATNSEDLHMALMTSPGHRANILNPKYTAVGIGVVHSGDSYYATQNFARATEDASGTEAEKRMSTAVNAFRREKRMRPIAIAPSGRLRNAICEQAQKEQLNARGLIVDDGYFGASATTASDLDIVPESVRELVLRPNLQRMAIGACFATGAKYTGGTYYFAFEY